MAPHSSSLAWTTPWMEESGRLFSPWNFPGKNTGVGCHFPSPGDLPNPGIEPVSPALQADALPSEPPGKPSSLITQLIGKLGERGTMISSTSRHSQPSAGGTEEGGREMEHGGWAHIAKPEAQKS